MSGNSGIGLLTLPSLSGIGNVRMPPVTVPPPPLSTFVITAPRFFSRKSRPLRVTRTPAALVTRPSLGKPFGITPDPAQLEAHPPPPQPAINNVAAAATTLFAK